MKLLATDYDGTLKYGDHIMPEDLQAIQDWKDAGNMYAIVTGRSKQSIFQQIEEYNLPVDYVVTNNGGMVFDASGNMLTSSYLDFITAIDIMYAMHEMDEVSCYTVNDGIQRHKIVINPNVTDNRYAHLRPDLSEEEVMNLGKFGQIVIAMSNPMSALDMAQKINEYFGGQVQAYANDCCVDVVPKDVSKATGLDFLCEYADIDEDDVFSLGDAYNDIPLMEYGMHGSAIEMAPEEVKEHALYIYPSVSEMVKEIL